MIKVWLRLSTPEYAVGLGLYVDSIILYYWQTFASTRWRSWLRHCATSRKVGGYIPDGVMGISHGHNPSGRTMALGSTQTLTAMSTSNISWGVKAAGV
jgi:hypothetical protein